MTTAYELDYINLVQDVISRGQYRECRNGETRALFGETLEIETLEHGLFPLLTQRQIHYKGVLGELAAFLRGATDLRTFKDFGCNYWDANAKEWPPNHGLPVEQMKIGQVYGAQWVNWRETGYNQLERLISELYRDPHGRRHVITSWDPLAESCLPPCHLLAQFFVTSAGRLDCQVYMRSVDVIHGLPSDVVLYAALMILVANQVNLVPGRLIFQLGDCHIYENHVKIFQNDQEFNAIYAPPMYKLEPNSVFDFVPSMLTFDAYRFAKQVIYPFNV